MLFNKSVFNTLQTGTPEETIEAYLYSAEKRINVFVQNPETLAYKLNASITPIIIPGLPGSNYTYVTTSPQTLTIPIRFDTYGVGKILDDQIAAIEDLMNPQNSALPVIGFRLGKTDFYPAHLIDFEYTVERVLNGSKATLSGQITLTKIASIQPPVSSTSNDTGNLSEREIADAQTLAKNELSNGILNYKGQSRIVAGLDTITVEQNGDVKLNDIVIGVYDTVNRFINYASIPG